MSNNRTIGPDTSRRMLVATLPDGTLETFSSWPVLVARYPEWERWQEADSRNLRRVHWVKRFGITVQRAVFYDSTSRRK